ncbi:MAG: hypothetical protein JKY03_01610 [Aureispira sp.]|nr:hypothetical protein [Aureispira sp.]
MDIIYSIKALMIGCMGAGGFYFFIALLLHYFPLPLFIKTQNIVDTWAIKRYNTEKALKRIWNIGRRVAQVLIVTMCLVLLVVFAYFLYNVLSFYIPIDNRSLSFLYYYLIAIVPPLAWFLFKTIKYLWVKKKASNPSPPVEEPPRKTLLEQIAGE